MNPPQTMISATPERRPISKSAVRLLPVLVFLLIFNACESMKGSVINATNVSLSAVQAAVNRANAGDTVNIPAGTAVWSTALVITNDIQLIGAGIGNTIIFDGGIPNSINLISWLTSSNYFDRLSGIEFFGTNNINPNNGSCTVVLHGICHAFRVDHCKWNEVNLNNLLFYGWMYGCVDHCVFYRNNVFGVEVEEQNWGGGTNVWGDGSWADADYLGTTNAIYVENNVFTNGYAAPGAFDMMFGGRIVFRYNYLTNDYIGFHGTETGGRIRGGREFEVYNNTVVWDTKQNSSGFTMFYVRSGSGVVFSNYIYNYCSPVKLANFRLLPNGTKSSWGPWGNSSGLNGWDLNGNNGQPYVIGVATASSSQGTLTDSTKNWTINCWVTNTGAFVVQDTLTDTAGYIYSNSPNTLYIAGSDAGAYPVITVGDAYTIGFVTASLDQPGRGQGNLLADTSENPVPNGIPFNTLTGGTTWPNEVSDPVYEWGNSSVMPLENPFYPGITAEMPTIVGNRDYFDGVPKPGYTPLVYPHPLEAATNGFSGSSFTLTVISGAGGGNYTNGAIVPISANATNTVLNGAFALWSGSCIANTSSAITSVTMPGSNLTVTAIYAPVPPPPVQVTNYP